MPAPVPVAAVVSVALLDVAVEEPPTIVAASKVLLCYMQAERKDPSEAAPAARSAAAAPAESPAAEDSPDTDAATNPFASPPEEATNPFLDSAPAPVIAPPHRASGEICACHQSA